jgi:phosphoglycolate phosphatase
VPLLREIQNKKHIIWDWNGTILNDVQHAVDTMNDLLSFHKLPSIEVEKYKTLFEFPVKNYYDKLGFNYALRSFEDLCHDFVDNFMDGFSNCMPFQKIEETLVKVREDGRTQSVLSATDQVSLDKMIKHFNFLDHFDFVYGIDNKLAASKVGRGKELINNSQIAKDETVLIGDTIHDLEVGEELGIDVVLITHGHQCEKILLKRHNKVLNILN